MGGITIGRPTWNYALHIQGDGTKAITGPTVLGSSMQEEKCSFIPVNWMKTMTAYVTTSTLV